ncbi:MAG: response regulator [Pirellulales bacterium]
MSNVLRIAIVDPKDQTREQLKNMLLGMEMVWLEAECSRYEFFSDVIKETKPDVGVINIDTDTEKAFQLIEKLKAESPDCAILVASAATNGQQILRAMRAGAKEFITLPISIDELMLAFNRINDSKYGSTDGRSRGCKVIAVAGATGGVGCTSLAVNIGCNLAQHPENSVALVDLDLALGDADVFLDTIPDYSLVDVTQNVSRLDFQLLRRSLTKHSSGLYLLPRPVQLQDVPLINPDSLRKVFGLIRASFTHVVLDISKSFSEVDLTAMSLANDVILIVQLDLPCLRNMVRLLMSFEEMEGIRDKVKIVVNRMGLESGQISLKKAKETIGRDVFHQIPNDYRTMVEMRNNGIPLIEQAPKAPITLAISQLTEKLIGQSPIEGEGVEEEKQPNNAANWLSFWPGKSKPTKAKK